MPATRALRRGASKGRRATTGLRRRRPRATPGQTRLHALLGAIANNAVSGPVLILAFIPVMLVAAGATWQRARSGRAEQKLPRPRAPAWALLAGGFCVGALTGFFGVGGGFVIVPVLTLWFGVTFRRAVATSLVIITLTGVAALGSHLAAGATPEGPITAALAGSTAVGAPWDAGRPAASAGCPGPRLRARRCRRRRVPAHRHRGAGWSPRPLKRSSYRPASVLPRA